MDAAALRALQAPLKNRYREDPATALVTSRAAGGLVPGAIEIAVKAGGTTVSMGLSPATGGSGALRSSTEMLLEALVGCAGVTLQAVATSMGIEIRSGEVRAEGDWDARGTLGVSRDVPVGLVAVRLYLDLETDAPPEQLQKLATLVERYCVVAQSLNVGVVVKVVRSET
jgi:uncharacterized OsmC-like protein